MKKIGLVVAMFDEAKDLFSALGEVKKVYREGVFSVSEYRVDSKSIFALNSGIGEIGGALATQFLILKFNVDIIINFGLVGALTDELKSCDLVRVKDVVHYDFSLGTSNGESYGKYPHQREDFVLKLDSFDKKIEETLAKLPAVRVASGDKFIESAEMRTWLRNQFSADICEMESAGIYFACKNNSVPVVMLKCVSDNADEHAQLDFAKILSEGLKEYISIVLELLKII